LTSSNHSFHLKDHALPSYLTTPRKTKSVTKSKKSQGKWSG
jgi:hypothetical protein